MGMGHRYGGRAAGQRDKIVIKSVAVKWLTPQQRWNKTHAPQMNAYKRKWRERNKEYIKEYNKNYYRRKKT